MCRAENRNPTEPEKSAKNKLKRYRDYCNAEGNVCVCVYMRTNIYMFVMLHWKLIRFIHCLLLYFCLALVRLVLTPGSLLQTTYIFDRRREMDNMEESAGEDLSGNTLNSVQAEK